MIRERFAGGIGAVVVVSFAVLLLEIADTPVRLAQADEGRLQSGVEAKAPDKSSVVRFPRNADEFARMFESVKNWGRWGDKDQLGTLNLITPQKRQEAIALAQRGLVIGLSRTDRVDTEQSDSPIKYKTRTALIQDTNASGETYTQLLFHNLVVTHLDGLCHEGYRGKTYNGYVIQGDGEKCGALGMERVTNGIVTRAILVDMPLLKGLPYLDSNTPVFVEDIEAWERKAGVKIGSGDALILRTGRIAREVAGLKDDISRPYDNMAGIHASVVPWLRSRDVSLIGSESALEAGPSHIENGTISPVHVAVIAGLGMPIIDAMDLEELAKTAARLHQWAFLLTVAPLTVNGTTGSPITPLAMF